jgi:hypothetical protein
MLPTLAHTARRCDDATEPAGNRVGGAGVRRWAAYGGAALAAAGFVVAVVALALPWATYRVATDPPGGAEPVVRSGGVAVFQLDRGIWYVLSLLILLGLLAGAATARGGIARAVGGAAVLLTAVALVVASGLGGAVSGAAGSSVAGVLGAVDVRAETGPGIAYGLIAPPLLGLGAALLSVRTP